MENIKTVFPKKPSGFDKIFFYLSILLIFSVELLSNFSFNDNKIRFPYYTVLFIIIFFSLVMIIIKNKFFIYFEDKLLIFMSPIIFSILIFYKFNAQIIMGITFFLFLILLSSSLKLINTDYKKKFINYIIIYLSIYGLLLGVISLFYDPPYLFRYIGIFDNSNSAGRFAGFISGFCLIAAFTNKKFRLLLIFIFLLTTFILVISNSRSPIFALIIALTVSLSKSFRQLFLFLILMTIIYVIFYQLYLNSDIFQTAVDSKLNRGASGRFLKWEYALEFIKFYPSNFYDIYSTNADPHNNYISLSLVYGFFYTIVFYSYLLIIILKAFYINFKQNDHNFSKYTIYVVYCLIWTLSYHIFETSTHISSLYTGLIIYWLISRNLLERNKINNSYDNTKLY